MSEDWDIEDKEVLYFLLEKAGDKEVELIGDIIIALYKRLHEYRNEMLRLKVILENRNAV
jgi:hypothetical protein